MKTNEKIVKVIKQLRKRENEQLDKRSFCNDHNMELQSILHHACSNVLRDACCLLQDEFETGYISIED